MGSAHFLTAALDVMADRYGRFLAEVPGLPGVREQLDDLRRDDLPGVRQPEDGDLLRRAHPQALHLRGGRVADGGRGRERHALARSRSCPVSRSRGWQATSSAATRSSGSPIPKASGEGRQRPPSQVKPRVDCHADCATHNRARYGPCKMRWSVAR